MTIVTKIMRLCGVFFWSLKNLQLHTKEGDLGLRDLKRWNVVEHSLQKGWNVVLLTKVLWNIHCKRDSS